MNFNLTESAKKKLKIGGIILCGLGVGYGVYKLIDNNKKKKALNGIRRRKKARASHKVINLL